MTEIANGATLDHGTPLIVQKWAGDEEGTEVRLTRFENGVCLTCLDYEAGELLMHVDLLTK